MYRAISRKLDAFAYSVASRFVHASFIKEEIKLWQIAVAFETCPALLESFSLFD